MISNIEAFEIEYDDSSALKYASNELKEDKEVVLNAVANHMNALKHASNELKKDKEVVLKAVCSDGRSLEYAPEE